MPEELQSTIGPQPGRQTEFLSSLAEIVIYGGSAGGGKSFGLLLEPLRNVTNNPHFSAVIFRRNMTEHRKPGATWDQSIEIYGLIEGAKPTQFNLEWTFNKGGRVVFGHLEYDKTVLEWHASQIPLICFDELTEFSRYQFFYMLTRNRSATAGVKPYVRATCNPDADSWVAELISWWIDQKTGFPIPERAGIIRYFIRVGDELIWGDSLADLQPEKTGLPKYDQEGREIPYMPKSLTFIPSKIYDNTILMQKDPTYLANLLAQPTVERERLLGGNWKIKPSAGLYFKRKWVKIRKPHEVPKEFVGLYRGWDLAATEKTSLNDPDWTCGTKIGKDGEGNYWVLHHTYVQKAPGGVETHIKIISAGDTRFCTQVLPQDPGQAGKWQTIAMRRALDGVPVLTSPETGDKMVRFGPFSSVAEAGLVNIVEGEWNDRWFSVLEGFPDNTTDDDVDSTSRSFNSFLDSGTGLIEFYKDRAAQLASQKKDPRFPTPEEEPPKSVEEGGVKIKAPSPNINCIYDRKGRPIYINEDGYFIVAEEHADALTRSGFIKVQAEIINLADVIAQMKEAINV